MIRKQTRRYWLHYTQIRYEVKRQIQYSVPIKPARTCQNRRQQGMPLIISTTIFDTCKVNNIDFYRDFEQNRWSIQHRLQRARNACTMNEMAYN